MFHGSCPSIFFLLLNEGFMFFDRIGAFTIAGDMGDIWSKDGNGMWVLDYFDVGCCSPYKTHKW